MRFICEWCFEKVRITDSRAPLAEILDHYTHCPRRPPAASEKHIVGLAEHMATLMSDYEKFEIRIRDAC